MHRQPFLKLLEQHKAMNAEEESNRQRTIAFVEQHPDCFERTCVPGHITGSSWLLNRQGTHVLLLHHRKLDIWVQLGGHCDGETDVLQVALREAQEESGIENIAPVDTRIVTPQLAFASHEVAWQSRDLLDHHVAKVAALAPRESEAGELQKFFDVDIHLIPERVNEPAHFHYDVAFLLQVQDNSDFVGNEESLALKWFAKDDPAIPLHHPNIRRMYQKWLNL